MSEDFDKYLGIANHDIQTANNMEELKSYVASILYDNDKKDKEIERLKELCDKYEEEHNTTFETCQKDIKENKKLHSIIKEVREYIEEKVGDEIHDMMYIIDVSEVLDILDKENK